MQFLLLVEAKSRNNKTRKFLHRFFDKYCHRKSQWCSNQGDIEPSNKLLTWWTTRVDANQSPKCTTVWQLSHLKWTGSVEKKVSNILQDLVMKCTCEFNSSAVFLGAIWRYIISLSIVNIYVHAEISNKIFFFLFIFSFLLLYSYDFSGVFKWLCILLLIIHYNID